MSSLVILALIGGFLAFRGFEVFKSQGLHFITGWDWTAAQDTSQKDSFGLGAMALGTLVISAVALVVGVPISVLTALFLTYYAPNRLKKFLIGLVDLMASFPSILYGLWGFIVLMPVAVKWAAWLNKYFDWIPIFKTPGPAFTRSPFIAGLVLAIMIIQIGRAHV